VLARQPYLVLPRNPTSTLYALSSNGVTDFMLHLGDPSEEQKLPTWREYFDEYDWSTAFNAGPARTFRPG